MADIKFVDEVPGFQVGRGAPKVYEVIAEKLRAQPGQWAEVRRFENGRSAFVGARILKRLGCEATTRGDGEARIIYARWPEEVS